VRPYATFAPASYYESGDPLLFNWDIGSTEEYDFSALGFTACYWFRVNSGTANVGFFNLGGYSPGECGIDYAGLFHCTYSTGYYSCSICNQGGPPGVPVTTDVWYHSCVTYEPYPSYLTSLWVNGQLIGPSFNAAFSSEDYLQLAANYDGDSSTFDLADFRFWVPFISNDQAVAIYQAANDLPPPTPQLWFNFQTLTADMQNFQDISGNGYDLSLTVGVASIGTGSPVCPAGFTSQVRAVLGTCD